MKTKTIECPSCGQHCSLEIGTEEAAYKCPNCNAEFTVSLIEEEQEDPASEASPSPMTTRCLTSGSISEPTPHRTMPYTNRKFPDIMNLIPPGKQKAVYLVWIFLNLMLLVLSPTPFGLINSSGDTRKYSGETRGIQPSSNARDYGSFYPFIAKSQYNMSDVDFNSGKRSPCFLAHIEQYDITEFVFYSLAPWVLLRVVRLWRTSDNKA
jgi:DNA-directed RNA polymerase subunit RPC12/RpoP